MYTSKLLIAISFCLFATCSNTGNLHTVESKDTSATPPLSQTLHTKVYDTIYAHVDTTEPSFDDLPSDILKYPQYRIYKKRKIEIAQWNKTYAKIRQSFVAHSRSGNVNIIDKKTFPTKYGQRTIIAWMEDMSVNISADNEYTCPEVTTGKGYFYGRLHFALLNTARKELINTIQLYGFDTSCRNDTCRYYETDEFYAYPFSIANRHLRNEMARLIYFAKGGTDTTDGEADLLHFVDFNRDGKKFEFGIFVQGSCVGKNSTLLGYSEKEDQLKWYGWDITWLETGVNGKDSTYHRTEYWLDEVVALGLDKNDSLTFEIDYRGRGGPIMRQYYHHNRAEDTYAGLIDTRDRLDATLSKPSWMPQPQTITK
jgi:hypothetical protein